MLPGKGRGLLPWICWDFINDVCLINKNKEGEGGVKMMMKKKEKFPSCAQKWVIESGSCSPIFFSCISYSCGGNINFFVKS